MNPTIDTKAMIHPYFKLMYRRVVQARQYAKEGVKERELWKKDKHRYEQDYYTREKYMSNDCISVNLHSVKYAIVGELFSNVETISWNDECKLAKFLGLPEDQPFSPFIDKVIAMVGEPDWLEEETNG